MKLPDDPKERKKVYLAVCFGACAVLYGLYAGVITPVRKSKLATVESIDQLKQQIHKAEKLIGQVEKQEAGDADVVDRIIELTVKSRDIIVPRLGNYLLSAREIVDAGAERAGLSLSACTEVGLSEIPQHAGRKTKNVFRSYTVRAGVSAGVYALQDLLRELETVNAYVCVHAMSITAQPMSPENHQVTLDIQWPTWSTEEVYEQFRSAMQSKESEEEQKTE